MSKTTINTVYREGLKERILKTAYHAFSKHGIKAVKMDDIARELSISKRTLYEVYENKEVLLTECLRKNNEESAERMASLAQRKANVMEIIIAFYHAQVEIISLTNPLFYVELGKYPMAKRFLAEHHRQHHSKAMDFFARGIKEGYFRNDVNYQLVSTIGEASLNHIMQTRMYETYPLNELFHNTIMLFIRGLCTEKGIRFLDKNL